jgi:hypothetical protein
MFCSCANGNIALFSLGQRVVTFVNWHVRAMIAAGTGVRYQPLPNVVVLATDHQSAMYMIVRSTLRGILCDTLSRKSWLLIIYSFQPSLHHLRVSIALFVPPST